MATASVNPAVEPDSGLVSGGRVGPGLWRSAWLLLGIKARLTWATLTRSVAVVVGVVLGAVWGLGMLALLAVSFIGLPEFLTEEGVRAVAVLIGSVGTVLWWIFAIISGRADATLHASQFALFPLTPRAIAMGQVLGALVGLAGPATIVALLIYSTIWRHNGTALLVGLLILPVGWLLMIVGNRCFTALAERLAAKRRVGEILTLLFLALLMLTGPILSGLIAGVDSLGERLYTWADVAAWTPFGALWAIPADVAGGAFGLALARAGVVAVTFAVLLWLWNGAIRRSLEQATGAVTSHNARHVKGAGLFDRMPAAPWAAVAARCLIYWVKDPRYSGSLVVVPVMFALFWFTSREDGVLLLFAAPFVALLMGYTISGDVAYDHKSFALHLLTGVPGWADRLGRVVGMLLPAVPLTTAGIVLAVVTTGRVELLPAMIGVTSLALLGGAGVSSVISARYTYPVPLPGQSPFKTPQGFTVLNVLIQFIALAAMSLLTLPAVIPFIMQLVTDAAGWGIAALVIGVVLGPVICAGGIWLGGKWLDARAPELLTTVSGYR